jgi:hypothetical protein
VRMITAGRSPTLPGDDQPSPAMTNPPGDDQPSPVIMRKWFWRSPVGNHSRMITAGR